MNREYKLEIDNLKNQLKSLATLEGLTLTALKMRINEKYNKIDSLGNLTNKFKRKTLKVTELSEMADILGYDIILRKK